MKALLTVAAVGGAVALVLLLAVAVGVPGVRPVVRGCFLGVGDVADAVYRAVTLQPPR